MKPVRSVWRAAIMSMALLASAAPVRALAEAPYPAKPIRWVVPYTAGGAADLVTRVVAQELSRKLGQPIVIDNRPGATGRIGSDQVARSEPDGYTLLTAVISSHAIAPAMSKTYLFDPVKDFTPIIKMGNSVQTLIARKSLPIHSVAELIDYAKKNPDKLNYGTTGPGSIGHIGGEMIRVAAGIDMVPVPYRGDSDAVKDVISGTLDVFLTPAARPSAEADLVTVLGVASPKRSLAKPDWKTISESGLPGFNLVSWTGLMGPAGLPPKLVELLNSGVNEVLSTPEVRKRLEEIGYEVAGGTSQEFVADIKSDVEKFRKLNEVLHIDMQ
jgi:tripartite-type tricarboxylate transporter receptor subunit TctC